MTDVAGNPEEERRAEFYHQPWSQEAVSRYFYCKVRRGPDAPGPPPRLEKPPLSVLSGARATPRGPSPRGSPPCSLMLFRGRRAAGRGGPLTHQQHHNPAPALVSLKIQQRRQELEQSLVVRNT